MKVLFINPPAFNEITTQVADEVTENSSFQPPLGLLYIAAYVREYSDHEVKVIDAQVDRLSYDQIEKAVSDYSPDVVGMTALTFTMIDVLLTVERIKTVSPSIKICLGGPHVDIYPTETIRLNGIDFAIAGEGEPSFLALLDELSGSRHWERVPGLIYKNREGKVVVNSQSGNTYMIDTFPFPDRTMLPYKKYFSIMTSNNPVGTLITAKGCPYTCTFCYERGKQARWRSGDSVAEEMLQARELGIKEMFFVDDTFYVKREKSIAIARALIERQVNMPWGARARVNNLDREMLETFKEAGCQRLHIGVEAGTNRILKNIEKKITVEQALATFKMAREVGINTMAYFIIGNPGERLDDVKATIDLACRLEPTAAQFSRMTPFPATKLYEDGLKSGLLPYDYWLEFAQNPLDCVHRGFRPLLWTENFTEEELTALADYATRSFYFRPSYVWRSAIGIRTFSDLGRKVKAAIDLAKGTWPSRTKLFKFI